MFAEKMEMYRKSINDFLENYLDSIKNKIEQNLFESMKYSLLSDGKRIRPILTLSVYDLLDKEYDKHYNNMYENNENN